MNLRPFVIDCDTGRDDALTLLVASAMNLPLRGVVTSYGNTSLANVSDNTVRILELAELKDVLVLSGAAVPLREHRLYKSVVLARQAASANGLCGLEPSAARYRGEASIDISELAAEIEALATANGVLDYFIIGPATNFARLCAYWGEATTQYIARVTMMGGRLGAFWAQNPTPDFNIACDPLAVSVLLSSGVPVRFLPLNATWSIELGLDAIETLSPRHAKAAFAKELMVAHCSFFAPEPIFRFHDPSVLLAALESSSFFPVRLKVICDEASDEFGRLVEDDAGVSCGVYTMTDEMRSAFLKRLLDALGLDFPQ